ncbi:MAG: RNA polymerase sigma factor [Candidatus Parcubacteria bacterium]|nr:RNA polymerase sigma factor [Candidatus Parcubacteria bacterium]
MTEEEFSKIYKQYLDKIYRFIYFKVNYVEETQDLTAKVFLKFWKKVNEPKKGIFDSNIKNHQAFLYKSAHNAVIDYYRTKSRQDVPLSSLPDTLSDDQAENNFEKKAEDSLALEAVRLGLHKIRKEYAEILILYYLNDMSIPEIKMALNKGEGSIRVMLHRAIKALRSQLALKEEKI